MSRIINTYILCSLGWNAKCKCNVDCMSEKKVDKNKISFHNLSYERVVW